MNLEKLSMHALFGLSMIALVAAGFLFIVYGIMHQ